MRRFLLTAAVMGVAVIPVMAQRTVINDPNVELRQVNGSYHGIDVSSAINLYLSQGEQETVAVSAADTKWRDRIRTEVDNNGVLRIWLDMKGFTYSAGNKKLKAYVSFSKLDRVKASGASDVYVDGVISAETLDITLAGASDFKGAIKAGALKLDQSGASDAQITGTVSGTATILSSGASDLKGYDLAVENCEATVSGASDIHITVNKELNARATGASSINYKGTAVIRDLHTSGASNVSKRS
jgi:hypothetical protein